MSRSIARMTPKLQDMYLEFAAKMERRGIPFMITSVDRTIIEQMALYVQGRLPLHDINKFRRAADMYPLPVAEARRVVTWTLSSMHVTNAMDDDPDNDRARAFDIAILKDKRPTWDVKVSVNDNEIPDYQEAGEMWESLGGTWGGRWKSPDYPHFQL